VNEAVKCVRNGMITCLTYLTRHSTAVVNKQNTNLRPEDVWKLGRNALYPLRKPDNILIMSLQVGQTTPRCILLLNELQGRELAHLCTTSLLIGHIQQQLQGLPYPLN
jgi:hypothetical protein